MQVIQSCSRDGAKLTGMDWSNKYEAELDQIKADGIGRISQREILIRSREKTIDGRKKRDDRRTVKSRSRDEKDRDKQLIVTACIFCRTKSDKL